MKLNYRRTLFVGFAFFLICAFWQAYDAIIPKILTDKFGMSQANSGIIMALDNVLALFMLPLFGAISDKCRSRLGKRTPFILFGTLAAAILLAVLSLADGMQLRNLAAVRGMDTPEALETLYDYRYGDTLMTPDGERYALTEAAEAVDPGVTLIPRERFMAMTLDTDDYARYVAPARQAYAHAQTKLHPQAVTLFIAILVLLLISMATFRSPAVALMPDVTLKPLRSKGNAVINLMGSAGGILILILGMVFATGAARNALMPYGTFFGIVSILMILSLGIFMLTVREPRFVQEMHQQSREYGIEEGGGEERRSGGRKLEADERRSLLFILLCRISGLLLALFGAIRIVGYVSKDLYRLAFQYDLAFGILLIALGALMMLRTDKMANVLFSILGIYVLADALLKVQIAIDAKTFGIDSWWLILAAAVVAGVAGFLLVLRPSESAGAVMISLGAALLAEGALNFITILAAVKIVRRRGPDV